MTTIQSEMKLNASSHDVFRAVASQAGIRGWWATDCDVAEAVGGENVLRFAKGDMVVTMRFHIDALDPVGDGGNARVKWTCTANDNPVWPNTTLTWNIDGSGRSCRLRFAHEGFEEDQSPPYKMTQDGWKPFLASLKSYVETGTGQPS